MSKGIGAFNQRPDAPVAVTEWKDKGDAVFEALELCGALDDFDPKMNILIKPNLVEWITKYTFPPFGIVATASVMEALVRYLVDHGAKNITIAEASINDEELGAGTWECFKSMGLDKLTSRYGVKLMDLNDEEFIRTPLGGFSLAISKPVLETDFLINLPVLKTHEQTKVSLGFKNNKGCLTMTSKTICHHRYRPLDDFVAKLGSRLYPNLTLIDGIYSLEMGPLHVGKAHRENLIVASRDMLNADIVGAYLMGYAAREIGHLSMFAEEKNRSLDLEGLKVRGLDPKEKVHKIRYYDDQEPWYQGVEAPAFFAASGVQGFRMPHPGQTLCTGCSVLFPVAILMIIAGSFMSGGKPYENYELLAGKLNKPSGTASKTFLMGDCMVAAHRKGNGINEAVPIKGCPGSLSEMVDIFNAHGIPSSLDVLEMYFQKRAESYARKGDLFDYKHYTLG